MRIISFWTKLCCGKESKLSTIIYKLWKKENFN
jgi:hypothetical protein